ncbi:hypothetical protein Y032_0108g19 [Ancylostoma ceylanicum]|uniref:Zinc metalloproteinase n=1 Tax=Ancylostoma ceylanicum TaxID=53326 RepID=A0A016TF83_9BILA|nr:hypothetical protein Y032_0108g19 [Ancylostoma ceylanicum]
MRILLLVLLLALCANAGFFDTKFGQKIKETLGKIKAAFNSTALVAIREKFSNLREKIKARLTLSPERKAILEELMKQIIRIKKDKVQEDGDSIDEINEKKHIAELLYQGDIVLTKGQANEIVEGIESDGIRDKRQAFKDYRYPNRLWSKGVHYYFHYNATPAVRSVFKKGADLWQKDTCIDFIEDDEAPDRIRVFKEDGCWSYIGRLGGEQDLSLGNGCETVGIAAHEIGHAIGFWHTHARYDRDRFITFNSHNVKRDWLDQFDIQTPATNDNYGITYDYGNIMHYGANSATWNGQPTMVPNDPKYMETLGSPIISFYELLMINKHYGCDKNCPPAESAQCKNGGFPHPRNCNTCICPSGYGGTLCDQKPDGCGTTYEATTEPKKFRDVVGNKNAGQRPREDMDFCYYWIKAPEGSRIEVKITALSHGLATDGCPYWGVEIKTHEDQRLTGYRFCAPEDVGVTLVSSSNIVPIITYNRFYATTVEIQYRIELQDAARIYFGYSIKAFTTGNCNDIISVPGVSSSKPKPLPQANCVDNQKCALLTKTRKFCSSKVFTESIKKALCPKACGYCR